MSNFIRRTKNPKTDNFEDAEWLDNYYGEHKYGVRFPDGNVYREDIVDYWETDEPVDNTSNTLKTHSSILSDDHIVPGHEMVPNGVVSDEVREQIVKIRWGEYAKYDELGPATRKEIDELLALITQQTTAARIDELKKLADMPNRTPDTFDNRVYVIKKLWICERLDYLEAELKKGQV